MALPLIIPPLLWAAGGAAVALAGKAVYDKFSSDNDTPPAREPDKSYLVLLGRAAAGKTETANILREKGFGFVELKNTANAMLSQAILTATASLNHRATATKQEYKLMEGFYLVDTGGSNRPENRTFLKNIIEKDNTAGIMFLYVFDAAKYLKNENIENETNGETKTMKIKDCIKMDINAYKEMADTNKKIISLKVLGTHADEIKGGVFSSKEKKILKTANEIRTECHCECEILDLTVAKPDSNELKSIQETIKALYKQDLQKLVEKSR